MSAVQVPVELVETTAYNFTLVLNDLHAALQHAANPAVCTKGSCPGARQNIAVLRALLPQPAPTCPNCGHPDNQHDDENTEGCTHVAADPATTYDVVCACPFPARVLGDLRDLLAAERDSKPTLKPGSDESFAAHAAALGADFDAVRREAVSKAGGRATPTKPRVWKTGDAEPDTVERAWDREDDAWIKRPSGKWRMEKNIQAGDGDLDLHGQPKGMQWADLLNEYGPLTEARAGGAR